MPPQRKKWCFTINNYTSELYDHLLKKITDNDPTYSIVGREKGSANGTNHLQGFIHFKEKKRFNQVKEILGNTSHIEPAKGTDRQNKVYCSKDGDFWEYGRIIDQGNRTDLECVAKFIQEENASIEEVAEKYPTHFIRYHRGLRELVNIRNQRIPRNNKTIFTVIWGAPGTGKSRFASEIAKCYESQYYKPRGEWWDGYYGQECIVVDDFYGWIQLDELLKVTDR